MDPNPVTSVDWNNIHNWLTMLWIYYPLIIIFAFSMMTAHAFIPSMVHTGHLPSVALKARIPLTVVGFICLAIAIGYMANIVVFTPDALDNMWERILI